MLLLWHVWISCKENSILLLRVLILNLSSHCAMSPLTQPPQSTIASFQTMRPRMFQHVNLKFINLLLKHMPLEEMLGLWTWFSLCDSFSNTMVLYFKWESTKFCTLNKTYPGITFIMLKDANIIQVYECNSYPVCSSTSGITNCSFILVHAEVLELDSSMQTLQKFKNK